MSDATAEVLTRPSGRPRNHTPRRVTVR